MGGNGGKRAATKEPEPVKWVEPEPGDIVEVPDFWKYWKPIRTLGMGRTCEVVEIVCKDPTYENKGPFACKILKRTKAAMRKLFDRECKILKKISHDNCINYINGYIDPKGYYIVTSLCDGGELFFRITSKLDPHISESEARQICEHMLLGVKHIHDQGIIHRDLKPENFMFDSKEIGSNLRLIDFGSSVIVEDEKSYKELAGTPYYMSPESVRNLSRSEFELRATDLWSIGVITYVALSRSPPFGGSTNKEIFTRILKYKLKWPRGCTWSAELKDFLRRIIDKDTFTRMTLDEALAHPWIRQEKLDMEKLHEHEILDCEAFTVEDRQLSRDAPLV